MKKTENHQQVSKLKIAVSAFGRVDLAYLFGFSAREDSRNPADIDVAVLYIGTLKADARFKLQSELSDRIEKIFKKRADVVLMNAASPFIKYQVIKHGKLVYESGRGVDSAFRFRTMTEYFESLMLQKFFYNRIFKRKRHG